MTDIKKVMPPTSKSQIKRLTDQETHWEGCEIEHIMCANAEIARLRARISELEISILIQP